MTTPSAHNAPQDPNERIDAIGDEHVGTSIDTPLRQDAFDMSDEDKIKAIEAKFRDIMDLLGLDLNDDSLAGTPHRVAKMYVKEIFGGLNPANHPDVKTFDNVYGYDHMLVERNITLNSTCEHHFLPIVGVATLRTSRRTGGGLSNSTASWTTTRNGRKSRSGCRAKCSRP